MSILVANFVLVFDIDGFSEAVEFVGEIGERERKKEKVRVYFLPCFVNITILSRVYCWHSCICL